MSTGKYYVIITGYGKTFTSEEDSIERRLINALVSLQNHNHIIDMRRFESEKRVDYAGDNQTWEIDLHGDGEHHTGDVDDIALLLDSFLTQLRADGQDIRCSRIEYKEEL